MQLPGQDSTRFQLTSAVTPIGRDNLAGIISGSYVNNQPKLEVLELPDQTAIPGPSVGNVFVAAVDVNGDHKVDIISAFDGLELMV